MSIDIELLKNKMLELVENQIDNNIDMVDAKELGEVTDMAKDMAEIMKLCSEAKYYHKITDAMDKNSNEVNMEYIEKYIPENKRYYMPELDDGYRNRMYYSSINDGSSHTHLDGKSYVSRRGYMEAYEHGDNPAKVREFEHYLNDLADDIADMVSKMDSNEKAALKQKISQMATKIV